MGSKLVATCCWEVQHPCVARHCSAIHREVYISNGSLVICGLSLGIFQMSIHMVDILEDDQ